MGLGKSILAASVLALSLTAQRANADWPQWRGVARDGHADSTLLPPPAEQPWNAAWKISIGPGHSSPIISGERVYFLDEHESEEVAHAVDLATGKKVWDKPFSRSSGDEWGSGPRSTPFADADSLYVQSCVGQFARLNIKDGSVVWQTSFEKDFGVPFLGSKAGEGTASRRGNNGSGLAVGDLVILPVGKTDGATLVAFAKADGKIRWKVGTEEAAYSSLVSADLAGRGVVIGLMADSLMIVDRVSGQLLAKQALRTSAKRHAASPVVVGNTVVVNSHTFGTIAFEASTDASGFRFSEKWRNTDAKVNLATFVSYDGSLFDQGPQRDYICLDASTGKQRWSIPEFGKDYASSILVGKNLMVLTDQGELVWFAAGREAPVAVQRRQLTGKTWSHPAVSGKWFVVRDQRELAAYLLQ